MIGQCAILGSIGRKLVQREGKILRGLRAQNYRRSIDRHAVRVGPHFPVHDFGNVRTLPVRLNEQRMCLRERLQAAHSNLLRVVDALPAHKASGDDRLHHGEQILGSMVQLTGQQILTGLRLLALRDVTSNLRCADDVAIGTLHG